MKVVVSRLWKGATDSIGPGSSLKGLIFKTFLVDVQHGILGAGNIDAFVAAFTCCPRSSPSLTS